MYWFEKILQKIEPRLERFAIPNLTLYIVGLNAMVYSLNYFNPGYVDFFTFSLEKIQQGQFWRIITYLFITPATSVIFILFALYFLYLVGTALEAQWGAFRLNLYYLLGMLSTTIVGFCFPESNITNIYLNTSLFLAFATLYPDFLVYIFFIIPLKVKYLAVLTWIGILFSIVFGSLTIKLTAIVSIFNYLLFFWPSLMQNAKVMHRGTRQLAAFSPSERMPFHKCFICGRTEFADKNLEFRVCSCGKEFCLEHLNAHNHN